MPRYIDADALKRVLSKVVEYDDDAQQEIDADFVFIAIDSTPTIDAAPVVHGRWFLNEDGKWACSACESLAIEHPNMPDKWQCQTPCCPFCGAIMDAKEDKP